MRITPSTGTDLVSTLDQRASLAVTLADRDTDWSPDQQAETMRKVLA